MGNYTIVDTSIKYGARCNSNFTASSKIFYTPPMRHLVDIGSHAEKEVIQ